MTPVVVVNADNQLEMVAGASGGPRILTSTMLVCWRTRRLAQHRTPVPLIADAHMHTDRAASVGVRSRRGNGSGTAAIPPPAVPLQAADGVWKLGVIDQRSPRPRTQRARAAAWPGARDRAGDRSCCELEHATVRAHLCRQRLSEERLPERLLATSRSPTQLYLSNRSNQIEAIESNPSHCIGSIMMAKRMFVVLLLVRLCE